MSPSSKPPSNDLVKPKPKNKKPGRKKPRRGGQPGHEQHLREPLPPNRVDQIIECEINDEKVERLGPTPTGDFETIQHIELPETPVHVTEYRLAVYQDADGQLYIPDCPKLNGPIGRKRPQEVFRDRPRFCPRMCELPRYLGCATASGETSHRCWEGKLHSVVNLLTRMIKNLSTDTWLVRPVRNSTHQAALPGDLAGSRTGAEAGKSRSRKL